MNRRHQSFQSYDYDRFDIHPSAQSHTRETIKPRERPRDAPLHGTIQYQDDSPISSEEDSYLTHSHHRDRKEKKDYFNPKQESSVKASKPEKPQNDNYNNKETKSDDVNSTTERLGRLEKMLEELVKRGSESTVASNISPAATNIVLTGNQGNKHGTNQYALEPRRFDFTTSMWINRIQEVAIQNNWHEKSIISYMENQMSGIIKAWYKNLTSYDYTWPEWKIMITRMFPDNLDFITTLKRLVTRLRRSDESIITYYFSKMYLIEACKVTGQDAVSCLIDGLNNQAIQEQAKSRKFLTPESLYSQFLLNLPDYVVDYAPLPSHSDSAPQPATASAVVTVSSGQESMQQDNWYYQEQQQSRRDRNRDEDSGSYRERERQHRHRNVETSSDFNYEDRSMEDGYNYHSREGDSDLHPSSSNKPQGTVHSRLDKRFIRPTKPKVPLAAKFCGICKNRGHVARNCSFKSRNAVLLCRFAENLSKKCYFKDCYVNSQKIQGFIDTGCTRTLIKESAARKLNLNIVPAYEEIEIYGGESKLSEKGKTRFLLELDSVGKVVDALVVPDGYQDVPVIIGQEFLNRKDAILTIHDGLVQITKIY